MNSRDGTASSPAPTILVTAGEERGLIEGALRSRGATDDEIAIVSEILVEADLRGIESHGLRRLPLIVARLDAGLARVGVSPRVVDDRGTLQVVDGRAGLGPVVADWCMSRAMEVAKLSGAGVVAVRNNNHLGFIGWYVERAARHGFVAIAMTTSEAFVRPHLGVERLLGTNPIAIGVPTADVPFVLDMSTSATAIGRLLSKQEGGETIPDDWAVDANGDPTTDPGAALNGAINPAGGAKGYGLALSISLVVSSLTATALGPDVVGTLDAANPSNKGDVLIALAPGKFCDRPAISAYLDRLRLSRPAPQAERVLVPGDRSRQTRERRLKEGIRHPLAVWEEAVKSDGRRA